MKEIQRAKAESPKLLQLSADAAYSGALVFQVVVECLCWLSIVRRLEEAQGFVVQRWRWIVERAFAWLQWSRRLLKDYGKRTESSSSWCFIVKMRFMSRRLAVPA